MKLHLPLYLPDRAALRTQVNRHGGIEERVAKSDVIIIDTETPLNSSKSRELFRQARGLPRPLPCVAVAWITDSIRAGVAQNVRNAVYDPIHLLEELDKKEERKRRVQEVNDLRQAAMMRSEVLRNPGAADLHEVVRLPGKNMYNTLDQHNIVEHLAVTKQRWAGSKVSEELVAKYGRHTRYSYQSYLRDNLEKGALLRLRAEEYMRTGENPIKITPRLRMVGGSGHHVGDSHSNAAPPPRQTVAVREHNGQDDGGFEDDNEGEEEDDPIMNSSGEPSGRTQRPPGTINSDSSASNGRLNHLGAFAPRGNLRGYRPHGTISHLDEEMQRRREEAEQELQAEEEARLAEVQEREESRPADASEDEDEEAQSQAQDEEGSENQQEHEDPGAADEAEESRFSPSDKHLLAMMVMNVLKRAIHEGTLSEDDIDGEGDAALGYLESRATMEKGQRLWHTIETKHPHHSADQWADHYWRWIGRYIEAAKIIMLEGLEDVATQQLQATQDPAGDNAGGESQAVTEDEVSAAAQEENAIVGSNGLGDSHQQHDTGNLVTASLNQAASGLQGLLQEALDDYLEEEELDELERSRIETDAGEVSALVETEIPEVGPDAQHEAVDLAVETDGERELSGSQLLHTADEDQRARHHDAKVNMRAHLYGREAEAEQQYEDDDGRLSPTEEALALAEGQVSRDSAQQIRTPSGNKRRRDDSEEIVEAPRQRRISSNAAIRAAEAAAHPTSAAAETAAVTPARVDRSHASSSGIPTVGSHAKIKYLDLSKDEVDLEQGETESVEDGSDVSQSQIMQPRQSSVAQGKRRQTEERPRGILRVQDSRSRRIHSTPLAEQPSRRPVEVYEDTAPGRPSSSRQIRRPSSREYASPSADDSRLSLSRGSASRSRSGGLEKEAAKLALQQKCIRLASKYGFSSTRQVYPFVSAAGLDTVKGEALIVRRFDVLAEEYGVQRDLVIEYVREADGSVEQAEKFLRLAEMSRSRASASASGSAGRGTGRVADRSARRSGAGGGGGGGQGRRRAEREVEEEASYSEEDDRLVMGEEEEEPKQEEVEEQPPMKRLRRRF
ncbi:hypothetical protein BCV69DRAFT_294463 [Microstroma glucosiphilum]|uniref:BRCT domain-containing protein n=1 Tax=Pseudomicrostroma glucosiphilum TaxID=1684307 RepID=A0A316U9Q5_9BASI|nr:hypothetical protein BCV69DRAFT_294463 [Pseudomicrostroma glucosiphilum]PWN19735.1 hypothetical protein BCV69DRAFT_294463 [Pseudomicrostroma glucosiphilum]